MTDDQACTPLLELSQHIELSHLRVVWWLAEPRLEMVVLLSSLRLAIVVFHLAHLAHTHTYTHNHFTALLYFVRDYLGELAPER